MTALPQAGAEAAKRPPRSDWVRNRTRILEAAEAVFGSLGLSVPIDEIAQRAGVGVGTIYRHFPTKEALFEAIVRRHFELLLEMAAAAGDEPCGPREALFGFLRQVVTVAVSQRDLAESLAGAGIDVKEAAGELKLKLEATVERLLERAQQDGSVRSDVSVADLMALVAGTCMSSERFGDDCTAPVRMLGVVCDGLRRQQD